MGQSLLRPVPMQSSSVLAEQWRAKALTAVDLSLPQSAAVLVHLVA
jgi:hypothetical protein